MRAEWQCDGDEIYEIAATRHMPDRSPPTHASSQPPDAPDVFEIAATRHMPDRSPPMLPSYMRSQPPDTCSRRHTMASF